MSGGCAQPDTANIRDHNAERIVLAGLLHDGRVCMRQLEEIGISRSDFYDDSHGRLFDLLYYCANGVEGPLMADALDEMIVRRDFYDRVTHREAAAWLLELWCSDPWMGDIRKWVDPDNPACSAWTFAALAAAAKLKHLSARRQTIYAAREAIRDALDPTGDADELQGRGDDVASWD